jgi:uncharacterized protein (DUF4415 family)
LTDKQIEAAVRSDPDAAPFLGKEWFKGARVVRPKAKQQVSLNLDRDGVEWCKAQGRTYDVRMGTVLRNHVAAHKKTRRRTTPVRQRAR